MGLPQCGGGNREKRERERERERDWKLREKLWKLC
jgi:hypothetical protein